MLYFSPLDVLDDIWDVIESVSEGFLTYSYDMKINPTYLKILRLNKYHMKGIVCGILYFLMHFDLYRSKESQCHANRYHTEESMVDENSVNAQQINECAVKRLESYMCAQLLRRF